jgi:hypothetical protein
MKHFIQTDLTLKYGSVPRFAEVMATIAPFLESHGWTLAGACSPIVGNLNSDHPPAGNRESGLYPGRHGGHPIHASTIDPRRIPSRDVMEEYHKAEDGSTRQVF